MHFHTYKWIKTNIRGKCDLQWLFLNHFHSPNPTQQAHFIVNFEKKNKKKQRKIHVETTVSMLFQRWMPTRRTESEETANISEIMSTYQLHKGSSFFLTLVCLIVLLPLLLLMIIKA